MAPSSWSDDGVEGWLIESWITTSKRIEFVVIIFLFVVYFVDISVFLVF